MFLSSGKDGKLIFKKLPDPVWERLFCRFFSILSSRSFVQSKIVILLPTPQQKPIIGYPFTELDSIDSTNNYAMALAQQGQAAHGTAWFAMEQTAGKGQRGRVWKMEKGQNIMLSVLLDTSWLPVSAQFSLSITIAVAVHDFFARYALDETCIKWPNDLYWRDRKAGGILIENLLKGNIWQWAVVGMGININQVVFDPALQNPVSLKQITGKHFDSVNLAKELCGCIEQRYNQLRSEGVEGLLERYNSILFRKGQRVRLRRENIAFECTIDHVDATGRLWLRDCIYPFVQFGEVRWEL
jgi:BirA family biotin operon repressor/biotin-[acetyl-CoA-carboxylase] ligase